MIDRILIRPDAELDIEEAYVWYEKQREGLGVDFLLCVEEGLSKIEHNTEMYPVMHKNVRRLLIRRFPYGIFYFTESNKIVVLAVFHAHRDPKQWKRRR